MTRKLCLCVYFKAAAKNYMLLSTNTSVGHPVCQHLAKGFINTNSILKTSYMAGTSIAPLEKRKARHGEAANFAQEQSS